MYGFNLRLRCSIFAKKQEQQAKLIAEGATDNGMPGDRALDFEYTL
jgi:hypothetical protein